MNKQAPTRLNLHFNYQASSPTPNPISFCLKKKAKNVDYSSQISSSSFFFFLPLLLFMIFFPPL